MAHPLQPNSQTVGMFTEPALQLLIKFVVGEGENQVHFPVPKTLLYAASKYCANSDNSETEDNDGTVWLMQFEPDAFAVFLARAYTGNARNVPGLTQDCFSLSPNLPTPILTTFYLNQWLKLAKAWVLAKCLQADKFQNFISDLMLSNCLIAQDTDISHPTLNPLAIQWIWENTKPNSAPRRLTLESIVSGTDPRGNLPEASLGGFHGLEEFFADIETLREFKKQYGVREFPMSLADAWRYHVHDAPPLAGSPCM